MFCGTPLLWQRLHRFCGKDGVCVQAIQCCSCKLCSITLSKHVLLLSEYIQQSADADADAAAAANEAADQGEVDVEDQFVNEEFRVSGLSEYIP